jgi:hypothetical protein
MGIKFILTLKTTSSPHLYLDQLKKLIEKDEYILPATRGYLNYMKKSKRSYIPLPLQSEVIISSKHRCNLTRGLSPQLTEFNKMEWTFADQSRWDRNENNFLSDIKKLYIEMGYEIKEEEIKDEVIEGIVKSFDEKVKKFKELTEKDK